jgi:adenosine deaminase
MPASPHIPDPANAFGDSLAMVDLHRHLEGSVRTSTVLDVARRDGHPLAREGSPRDLLVADPKMTGLVPYLERVDAAIDVLTREEDWERAAREAVSDAYDDGLAAVELRFAPWLAHVRTGLQPEAVIDAVASGVRQAQAVTPLPVGLIGILVRDLGPETARDQLGAILHRRDSFCAIDIAGDEAGFRAELFADVYDTARTAGLRLTAHAGEAAGPRSVWDTVLHLGVERVGHGVRAAEDPRLMDHLASHGITLEVAISSNVQTSTAESYATHQIRTLLDHGVPVTLNTDNPRASNVTLSQEYTMAGRLAGLTGSELAGAARQSIRSSFLELSSPPQA